MPPFLPRKRLRSPSIEAGPSGSKSAAKEQAKGKSISTSSTARKPTLFDDLDAGVGIKRSAEQNKALLEKLAASNDDDESSLSTLSDEEFEDIPTSKRRKANESDDEDDDIEFEDVETHAMHVPATSAPLPSGDLELTLTRDTRISITNPFGSKKGPTKIERAIRTSTHQMHVMCLMWHNAIRNVWLCDKELHDILVKRLPPRTQGKVDQWRLEMGIKVKKENSSKGKGKGTAPRNNRDWGGHAERVPGGEDPSIELVKKLVGYWQNNFRIIAPGLRKLGYMSLQRLDEEMKSFNKEEHDPERHGERIRDVEEFRECARTMEGSRDVGAQLFTALLRGLGLEARMVASLQPSGFAWSQFEEAVDENPRILKTRKPININQGFSSSDEEQSSCEKVEIVPKQAKRKSALPPKNLKKTIPKSKMPGLPARRISRGSGLKDAPIDLSEPDDGTSTDASIVDITPRPKGHSLQYDKDLSFPHYWTEILLPTTNTYTPVEAMIFHIVATTSEMIEKFEPRGSKADKAKQVTAYIVGHSSDGTAKDITTRYLKRRVWPGRTKGNRLPIEKIPIHNRHGKVIRYEGYDWFKQVMSGYSRGTKSCPRTEVDDHEEATDLKPVKAEKKEVEEGKETLQSYKASTEFVLERHLRREEALIPKAKHVKTFAVGKGEAAAEEKVFLRKDVVNCKSMETWHKEGRAPKLGEEPLKRVPYRAATTNRKRELAEAEHASGEKMLQGLYSWDQTDWIIPPPIENGVIPKNGFGNIDLYVDSMLPEGAAHIPRRGTVKICKRLGVDYAEAVTGFEFGHRMAVPIITGVVVAEEHYETIMNEWYKDEKERERKEDEKRRKAALNMWRKMLMGLRIVERFKGEYGDGDKDEDVLNPWINKKKSRKEDRDTEEQKKWMDQRDEERAGGFLPEGYDVEDPEEHRPPSFFPVTYDEHDEHDDDQGGGFIVEDHHKGPKEVTNGPFESFPTSMESGKLQVSDEEVEMEEAGGFGQSAQEPKKIPIASINKFPKSKPSTPTSKVKTAVAASIAKRKAPASNSRRKRQVQVQETDGEEGEKYEDGDDSSLSELDSSSSSEEEAEKPTKKPVQKSSAKRGRRSVALPNKRADTTRKTPRRSAAKMIETGVRSRYFEHSDDDDDDDDDD